MNGDARPWDARRFHPSHPSVVGQLGGNTAKVNLGSTLITGALGAVFTAAAMALAVALDRWLNR